MAAHNYSKPNQNAANSDSAVCIFRFFICHTYAHSFGVYFITFAICFWGILISPGLLCLQCSFTYLTNRSFCGVGGWWRSRITNNVKINVKLNTVISSWELKITTCPMQRHVDYKFLFQKKIK